jgi:hypothetical protein
MDVLEAIKDCMNTNKTLPAYDFRYNDLKDQGKYSFYSNHPDSR